MTEIIKGFKYGFGACIGAMMGALVFILLISFFEFMLGFLFRVALSAV